jgi:serine phosphatase RsbU (regulator of sigma subunit)
MARTLPAGVADAMRGVRAAVALTGPDDLPGLVTAVAPAVGAAEIVIYLADYPQTQLVPLTAGRGAELAIESTLAGRAYISQEVQHATEHPDRLWVPLVDGCERLGVLEFVSPEAVNDEVEAACTEVAAHVAQLVKNRRPYGDTAERARRRMPMHIAAEIVWGLLPPLTFATGDVDITAILEPCYDVGGDVFDYALNGDLLSFALFDTCGHGIAASTLAALTINAYRNARRSGLDLVDTAAAIDVWLRRRHPAKFATAILAELDHTTGTLRTINAGHPGAQVLREGRAVKELPGPTALPLGLHHMSGRGPGVHEEALQSGDRVLAYTDGVIDARNADGERFGLGRLLDLVQRALNDELPAPESMRRLVRAVVEHQFDELQDDATAVLVQWRPAQAGR